MTSDSSATPSADRAPRAALRRAVALTASRRRGLWLSVGLGAGAVLAAVGLLTTSGYLISRAAERPEVLALSVAIVGVRFFGISRALLRYAERLASHDLAFRTLSDFRRGFFERLVPLLPGGLSLRRSDMLSRFVGDVDRLQDLYLRALGPPLIALIAGAASVLVATLILPAAALVLAAMLLAAGVLAPYLTRRAALSAGRRQGAARAALSADLVEIAGSSAEIAVAGREADWIERAERSSAELARLQRRDAISNGLAAGLSAALAAGAAIAVTAVAIPAVEDGRLAGVMLAALALLALAAFEAVAPLGAAAASVDACAGAALRIEAVVEREPPLTEPTSPLPLPACGALELHDVRFRYGDSGPWLLDGIDMRLRPGESLALLGPSGSGKSTIAELAVRFRDPEAGEIRLGGVDLRRVDGDALRSALRLSPQDAYLFTTTLRDNVAIGRAGASEGEIEAALRAVGLGAWLDTLADGLGTEVGEAGAMVSGGQRQRIAAARLFLADADLLIFDEPTAHLDRVAAAGLQRSIAGLAAGGQGILLITHELHEPSAFDETLVLDGGVLRPHSY